MELAAVAQNVRAIRILLDQLLLNSFVMAGIGDATVDTHRVDAQKRLVEIEVLQDAFGDGASHGQRARIVRAANNDDLRAHLARDIAGAAVRGVDRDVTIDEMPKQRRAARSRIEIDGIAVGYLLERPLRHALLLGGMKRASHHHAELMRNRIQAHRSARQQLNAALLLELLKVAPKR